MLAMLLHHLNFAMQQDRLLSQEMFKLVKES